MLHDSEAGPAGDPAEPDAAAAVTALFRQHATDLIRCAVVVLGDRPMAEDVVQEAFCGLFRRWSHLSDPGKALPYVRSAVLNRCRTVLRSQARRTGSRVAAPAAASAWRHRHRGARHPAAIGAAHGGDPPDTVSVSVTKDGNLVLVTGPRPWRLKVLSLRTGQARPGPGQNPRVQDGTRPPGIARSSGTGSTMIVRVGAHWDQAGVLSGGRFRRLPLPAAVVNAANDLIW